MHFHLGEGVVASRAPKQAPRSKQRESATVLRDQLFNGPLETGMYSLQMERRT